MLDTLSKLGPFIGGISLAITALLAGLTAATFNKRSLHLTWINSFRQLYDEYWRDPAIAQARRWISNDIEYLEVEPILLERLKTETNKLDSAANDAIETIDRFCALITKVEYFDRTMMTGGQRDLWEGAYVDYWLRKMSEREALREYVRRFWPRIPIVAFPGAAEAHPFGR